EVAVSRDPCVGLLAMEDPPVPGGWTWWLYDNPGWRRMGWAGDLPATLRETEVSPFARTTQFMTISGTTLLLLPRATQSDTPWSHPFAIVQVDPAAATLTPRVESGLPTEYGGGGSIDLEMYPGDRYLFLMAHVSQGPDQDRKHWDLWAAIPYADLGIAIP
ncbi:MAG TPA: hypothetical protein VEI97_21295, partial [bacterium]|nr:hypothetical protein [bacterium]